MVVFAGLVVIGWGGLLSVRHIRAMWTRGDHGLAAAVLGASAMALILFACMLATVAVAMLPQAFRGGAG
jgi:Na+-translocating ferredoxin:NAD+ oxidoreductase RnfA subunit